MILMIDNYDSFTYNIVQYCLELGADLKVIRNDELSLEQIIALNPSKIIISPGPATPKWIWSLFRSYRVFCRKETNIWNLLRSSSNSSGFWGKSSTCKKYDAW